jgi:hypothetical protein
MVMLSAAPAAPTGIPDVPATRIRRTVRARSGLPVFRVSTMRLGVVPRKSPVPVNHDIRSTTRCTDCDEVRHTPLLARRIITRLATERPGTKLSTEVDGFTSSHGQAMTCPRRAAPVAVTLSATAVAPAFAAAGSVSLIVRPGPTTPDEPPTPERVSSTRLGTGEVTAAEAVPSGSAVATTAARTRSAPTSAALPRRRRRGVTRSERTTVESVMRSTP